MAKYLGERLAWMLDPETTFRELFIIEEIMSVLICSLIVGADKESKYADFSFGRSQAVTVFQKATSVVQWV